MVSAVEVRFELWFVAVSTINTLVPIVSENEASIDR